MVAYPLMASTTILSGTSWLFIYTKLRFGPSTAKFAETDVGSWVVKGKVRERRILVNSVKRDTGWTHGDCNVLYNPLVVELGRVDNWKINPVVSAQAGTQKTLCDRHVGPVLHSLGSRYLGNDGIGEYHSSPAQPTRLSV